MLIYNYVKMKELLKLLQGMQILSGFSMIATLEHDLEEYRYKWPVILHHLFFHEKLEIVIKHSIINCCD